MKQKYIISNLVYGDTYSKLFCNNHLKSLVDETNLRAIRERYETEYIIYTDHGTRQTLVANPYFKALHGCVDRVSVRVFTWPDNKTNKFLQRYGLLLSCFKESVKYALEQNAWLTNWVADLVVAKEFFPRILKRMEDGHGAVFVLPLRSASESVTPKLQEHHFALKDMDLHAIAFESLHPLWVACHWDNPQFTRLPFCLLWGGQGGVLARTFSTTPIVFKPTAAMLESRGMIDGDIPALCENPYWCEDWTDVPVVGVELLIVYYPPFANRPASTQLVRDFTSALDPTQKPFLEKRLWYPSRSAVTMSAAAISRSDEIVKEILSEN